MARGPAFVAKSVCAVLQRLTRGILYTHSHTHSPQVIAHSFCWHRTGATVSPSSRLHLLMMSSSRIAACSPSSPSLALTQLHFHPFKAPSTTAASHFPSSSPGRKVLVAQATVRGPPKNASQEDAVFKVLDMDASNQEEARSQLDFLDKLTSSREKDSEKVTIAEQLASRAGSVEITDDAEIPLGKKVPMDYSELTISQKRNIRRQQYLDTVSKRNDAPFFGALALLIILPPMVILGVAVATGYVDLLP